MSEAFAFAIPRYRGFVSEAFVELLTFVLFGSRGWSIALSLFDYTTAAVNVRTASRDHNGVART